MEQQPQPEEEAVKGSSVRDGVCMSVPFIAEKVRWELWLNGSKEGAKPSATRYSLTTP